jgi:hypothetical protein
MTVVNFKNGALIAIAAGSLFAAACKKADEKTTDKAGDTKPAGDLKAGEMKPEGEEKPAETKPEGEAKPAVEAKPVETKPGEKTAKVNCLGVNSCKGQSACKTASNACAGQNGCGGKGFIELTEEECKTKGGTVAKN